MNGDDLSPRPPGAAAESRGNLGGKECLSSPSRARLRSCYHVRVTRNVSRCGRIAPRTSMETVALRVPARSPAPQPWPERGRYQQLPFPQSAISRRADSRRRPASARRTKINDRVTPAENMTSRAGLGRRRPGLWPAITGRRRPAAGTAAPTSCGVGSRPHAGSEKGAGGRFAPQHRFAAAMRGTWRSPTDERTHMFIGGGLIVLIIIIILVVLLLRR
jgi:hypothetical protein